MAKKSQKTQRDFRHTWYIQEWAAANELTQAKLAKLAGWSKATGSDIWNGQQYTQTILDTIAPILNARPFELLLPPEEAFAIRRMREAAARIVADNAPATDASAAEPARRAK